MLDDTLLVTAGSAMASAIVAQWLWFTRQFKTVEKKLDHCEAGHEDKDREIARLWSRVTQLSTKLAIVAACSIPDCPLKKLVSFATMDYENKPTPK